MYEKVKEAFSLFAFFKSCLLALLTNKANKTNSAFLTIFLSFFSL